MIKILTSISFIFAFSISVEAGRPELKCPKGKDKVVVCHKPPGNPDREHIISVGRKAVEAHLKHGDHQGLCSSTKYEEMRRLCGICDEDVDPTCE